MVAQWQTIHLPSRRYRFDLWAKKIPWRRKWQTTPGSLPGKLHGQKSLAGYSPQGRKRAGHSLATETTTNNHIRPKCRKNRLNAFSISYIFLTSICVFGFSLCSHIAPETLMRLGSQNLYYLDSFISPSLANYSRFCHVMSLCLCNDVLFSFLSM